MSKFNWEKQNKAEQPKAKRTMSNRTKVLRAYENGAKRERERIIKLLEARSDCGIEHAYNGTCFCEEIALIKGEQK